VQRPTAAPGPAAAPLEPPAEIRRADTPRRLDTDIDALVNQVNRADLWKEAAKAIGQDKAIPASDSRGKETFFDGVVFDPENPKAYLDALKIKAMS
jgi:hypothetical protein